MESVKHYQIKTDQITLYATIQDVPNLFNTYMGTKILPVGTSTQIALAHTTRLTLERRIKHTLSRIGIDSQNMRSTLSSAVEKGLVAKDFFERRWGTAAAVIVPSSKTVAGILQDESDIQFPVLAKKTCQAIKILSDFLEEHQDVFLRPTLDFDGNKPKLRQILFDVMKERTAGYYSCGKSSYTTTGVLAAARYVGITNPVSIVGYGNLGIDALSRLHDKTLNGQGNVNEMSVCDFAYKERFLRQNGIKNVAFIEAQEGYIHADILRQGGTIIITINAPNALSSSDIDLIPEGTTIIAGSNQLLAPEKAVEIAKQLKEKGVTYIPGEIATVGGPTTARIETEIPIRTGFTVNTSEEFVDEAKDLIHNANAVCGHLLTKKLFETMNIYNCDAVSAIHHMVQSAN